MKWLILIVVSIIATAVGCGHKDAFLGGELADLDQEIIKPESIQGRLILIGDAGVPSPTVMSLLETWTSEAPDRTLVIYLGDNVYPAGVPEEGTPGHGEAISRLDDQLAPIVNSGCSGVFLPGNHDWGVSGEAGLARLRRQSEYIESVLGPDGFAPEPGCPGPELIERWGFRVLVIDTQWWLRVIREPGLALECAMTLKDAEALLRAGLELIEEGESAVDESEEEKIEGEVSDELVSEPDSAESPDDDAASADDLTIVVGHHPLLTYGPHGGYFGWKDHIFPLLNLHPSLWVPLPVIGSIYPLSRNLLVNNDQDLGGSANVKMRKRIGEILSQKPPLLYANGHDHNLQLLTNKPWAEYSITSGSASKRYKVTPVGRDDSSQFAHSEQGFFVLDRLTDGSAFLRVVEVTNTAVRGREDGAVAGWRVRDAAE